MMEDIFKSPESDYCPKACCNCTGMIYTKTLSQIQPNMSQTAHGPGTLWASFILSESQLSFLYDNRIEGLESKLLLNFSYKTTLF